MEAEQIATTAVKKLKTVSFKEVHQYLEKQAEFLTQDRDYHCFSSKGNFLDSIGLKNSVTTKAYNDLANKKEVISYYNSQYGLKSKFILQSQVEKLCMEYNLYVRKVEDFLGDIPEANIEQMANFTVNPKDLDFTDEFLIECFFAYLSDWDFFCKYTSWFKSDFNGNVYFSGNAVYSRHKYDYYWLDLLRDIRLGKAVNIGESRSIISWLSDVRLQYGDKIKLVMRDFISKYDGIDFTKNWTLADVYNAQSQNIFKHNIVLIAAVKELFSDEAFSKSDKRIYKGDENNGYEMPPRSQVDTDPVVLVETKDGYLIVTAWGDEANSEVVVNHNFN